MSVDTSRAFGRGLLAGIAKYSRAHGPWAFYRRPPYYMQPPEEKGTFPWLKKLVRQVGTDGIIMGVPIVRMPGHIIKEVIRFGVPVIALDVNEEIPDLANVVTDDVEIGKMAAEYLLDRGFREFAFCGFEQLRWSRVRREGFCQKVQEAGFDVHVCVRPKSNLSAEQEQRFVVDWLSSLPKPVGLMVCNDDRGQYVTEACKIINLHVPEEVAIIGVDNDELVCDLTDPPLSSVAINTEKAGFEAAKLLEELMAGAEIAGRRIMVGPTHVVTRQSTDILAIEDHEVAAAVQFIRQHAKRIIQVNDVASAVGMSRRSLYKKFQQTLGRSVHKEITRVRIEQISKMLLETHLPVSQIASTLGYPGTEKLTRFFRREKGLTPAVYRKKYSHR